MKSVRQIAPLACSAIALGLAACGGGDGGGSNFAVGEEAVVEHTTFLSGGKPGPKTTVGITVVKVTRGTQDELKTGGLELDPEEQKTTPYYVDVRFENQGSQAIQRDLGVLMEDDDGNSVSATVIIEFGGPPFAKCTRAEAGELAAGDSYETCLLFLLPEGKEAQRVSFLPYDPETPTDHVYWDIE
jgi:hypothetical protein